MITTLQWKYLWSKSPRRSEHLTDRCCRGCLVKRCSVLFPATIVCGVTMLPGAQQMLFLGGGELAYITIFQVALAAFVPSLMGCSEMCRVLVGKEPCSGITSHFLHQT